MDVIMLDDYDEEPFCSPDELIARCKALLDEMEELKTFSSKRKKESQVGIRRFMKTVKSELKLLERLLDADPEAEKTRHAIRCSNLPHHEAVWAAGKTSSGLVAFDRKVYWNEDGTAVNMMVPNPTRQQAIVDIVSNAGLEWIKVSTISEKRLLRDLNQVESWRATSSGDDDADIPALLKLANDLSRGSRATRVRYQHPSVRFVLPMIERGSFTQIDRLLHSIEATGAQISCKNYLTPPLPIANYFTQILVDEIQDFSDVLNLDCTILLALVSDISHQEVKPESGFHTAVLNQIENEKTEKLLPQHLYPALGSRRLVCTEEAVRRFREIVDLIGTSTERCRADILTGIHADRSRDVLLATFARLSNHTIPADLQLPVQTVKFDVNSKYVIMSPLVQEVAAQLSGLNRSVFFYGWAYDRTTISSNRVAAKTIDAVIEAHPDREGTRGPHIWLCPVARSLVAKAKRDEDWDLP